METRERSVLNDMKKETQIQSDVETHMCDVWLLSNLEINGRSGIFLKITTIYIRIVGVPH